MIHAYLFVLNIREGNGGHGPNFKRVMEGINRQAGTNITVYHSFHDEVRLYQKHWWRCNGPCQNRKPFYGYVKRCQNRPPGRYDFWFAQHERDCGGTFIKIKEPTPKKKETKPTKGSQKKPNQITNYIQTKKGGGNTAINRGGTTLVVTKPPTTTKYPDNKSKTSTGSNINTIESPPIQVQTKPPIIPSNIVGFKDLEQNKGAIPKVPTKSIPSSGQTLGGSNGNKRSRLLDQFEAGTSKKKKTDSCNISAILLDDDQDDILRAVDLDEIERENNITLTQADKAKKRQTIIKQEILDSHGFTNDDSIIIIDDEYDDELAGIDAPCSDGLNLTKAVIDDLFSDDMLGKANDNRVPCPICENRVSPSSQKEHIEQCYEDLLKACEAGTKLPIPSSSTSKPQSNNVITKIKTEKKSPRKNEADVIIITDTGPINENQAFLQCPVCPLLVPPDQINDHLDKCLENSFNGDF